MKILSDDARIIDDLFNYLEKKNISLEKIEITSDNESSKRPMGGGLETFLSMGANFVNIATGVTKVISYINRNYPEWYVVFLPKNEEIPMTSEEYEKMSDDAKRATLEHYDIRIKKK